MKKIKLRNQVFESAIRIVENEGIEELNARKLAASSSCALGSIYNVFGNLQDLQLHVNATILSRLYENLSKTVERGIHTKLSLLALFKELGLCYLEFAQKNRSLWKALFEYSPNGPGPEWYAKRAQDGIYKLCQTLSDAYKIPEAEAKRLVGFFWSSIHGMSAILSNRKMEMVSELFQPDCMGDYIEYSLTGLFKNKTDELRLPK